MVFSQISSWFFPQKNLLPHRPTPHRPDVPPGPNSSGVWKRPLRGPAMAAPTKAPTPPGDMVWPSTGTYLEYDVFIQMDGNLNELLMEY